MDDRRKLLKSFCREILRSPVSVEFSERCEETLWWYACATDEVAYDRVFLKLVPKSDEDSYALLDVDESSWSVSICGKLSRADQFSKSVEKIARDVFGSLEDEDEDL